jgi:hypothetical protein
LKGSSTSGKFVCAGPVAQGKQGLHIQFKDKTRMHRSHN